MRSRNLAGALSIGVMATLASCGPQKLDAIAQVADGGTASLGSGGTLSASTAVRARVDDVRRRFVDRSGAPVLRAAQATTFESSGSTVRALVGHELDQRTSHAASIEVPTHGDGIVRIADDSSHVSARFALRGAGHAAIAVADGFALFAGALEGADVLHRIGRQGLEDYVVFEQRPAHDEVVYDLLTSEIAGLRLVSNTLELLDHGGAPRIRVAPPYLVDIRGARHLATLRVTGCAVDTEPAPPWSRPVTSPGAASCAVHVAWDSAVVYPALLDPAWTPTGSMTVTRNGHPAVVLGSGRVLLEGGYDGASYLASAELYDPATATFAVTGSMGAARSSHSASLLKSGKVLVVGGFVDGAIASAELYDPATGTFAPTGALPVVRYGHQALTLASGKVLVLGGTSDGSARLSTVALYDPLAGTFAPTGSMSAERDGATVAELLSGKVLVAGGASLNGAFTSAELYDPTTGTFSPTGPLSVARQATPATLLPTGKVLVAGGSVYLFGGVATAELYDPATGTFTMTGPLHERRGGHTASVLRSGKVLMVGGFGEGEISTTELYDPKTGLFTLSGSTTKPRSFHTASVLHSGKVLVTGYDGTAEVLGIVAVGETCKADDDCVTGSCGDGICCAKSCAGECKTCSPGTGACVSVVGRDDADTCTGLNTCTNEGACKLKVGQPCPGGNGTCASGFCADGFCCNSACDGGCDSCNVPGKLGTCTVESAGYPGASPACAPYVCGGASASCATSCAVDADCTIGNTCDPATHRCGAVATCDGEHITMSGAGTKDCSPYKCENSGVCKLACTSADDCVLPSACDPTGHCVLSADNGSEGCSSSSRSPSDALPIAFFALALGLTRVRRRPRAS